MQDYEKRFSRLEERMFKEMNVSKSESRKNFDSLEKFVHKEIESLKDRVAAEQNARSEAFRDISRQLKDLSRSLEKKVDNLNEQFSESETDLRHQVSELSQSLRNEIRQKYDEISSVIERVAQELQVNKLDRSSFSEFLTEMAMRVSNRIEN
jgi:phage host-nuclease inhibitor protein Gam